MEEDNVCEGLNSSVPLVIQQVVATLTGFFKPFESFTVVASHGWSTEVLERSKERVPRMGWSTRTSQAKRSSWACVLKTMGNPRRCMNRIVSQYSEAVERALRAGEVILRRGKPDANGPVKRLTGESRRTVC